MFFTPRRDLLKQQISDRIFMTSHMYDMEIGLEKAHLHPVKTKIWSAESGRDCELMKEIIKEKEGRMRGLEFHEDKMGRCEVTLLIN